MSKRQKNYKNQLRTINVIICGVGGQGVSTIANILSTALFYEGFDVKKSEIIGMSQRGGSVNVHVRCGSRIYSPVIEMGTADYILSLENLEALRYVSYLKKGGVIIINDYQLLPLSVLHNNNIDFKETLFKSNTNKQINIDQISAYQTSLSLGDVKMMNMIMLGRLAYYLGGRYDNWKKAISDNVKQKIYHCALEAFQIGSTGYNGKGLI